MPVDDEIIEIENHYWLEFDNEIHGLSAKNGVKYFDFNHGKTKYKTYDGNHIDKYAGVIFTHELCDSISTKLSN
jgi:hypothetical protein